MVEKTRPPRPLAAHVAGRLTKTAVSSAFRESAYVVIALSVQYRHQDNFDELIVILLKNFAIFNNTVVKE